MAEYKEIACKDLFGIQHHCLGLIPTFDFCHLSKSSSLISYSLGKLFAKPVAVAVADEHHVSSSSKETTTVPDLGGRIVLMTNCTSVAAIPADVAVHMDYFPFINYSLTHNNLFVGFQSISIDHYY